MMLVRGDCLETARARRSRRTNTLRMLDAKDGRKNCRQGGLKNFMEEGKGEEISAKLSFSYVIVVIRFREEDWLLLLQCLWSAQVLFIGSKEPMSQYLNADEEKRDG